MVDFFMDLPWQVAGIFVVGSFITITLLILAFVRSHVSQKVLRASHDVAGYTFGIIGVIYAVLLGFIVVEVNNRFNDAERNVLEEAAVLTELYRDADVFAPAERNAVHNALKEYTQVVALDEWESMRVAKESVKAQNAFLAIWQAYYRVKPVDVRQQAWYAESLSKLNELSKQRVLRLFNANQSLGSMMWTLLLVGACITVFFICFFVAESAVVQSLMAAALAGCIAFMLFLVLCLDTTYSGDVRVSATPLHRALEMFEKMSPLFKG